MHNSRAKSLMLHYTMFTRRLFVVSSVLFFTSLSAAYKILMVPMPAKSHIFPMLAIGDGLTARGHEVTVLLAESFPVDVTKIDVGQRVEKFDDNGTDYEALSEQFTAQVMNLEDGATIKQQIETLTQVVFKICHFLLVENEPLMRRLETYKFDLLVIDVHFFYKCFYLIPHRLRAPFVTYTDYMEPLIVRSPWLPSFVPNSFGAYSEDMSFFQRFKNAATLAATAMISVFPDPPAELLDGYRRLYGDFRFLDDLASRSLLWLYPRDHLVDYAKPTMPNIVNVGGLTAKRSTGELPSELKTFVEGAPNGTIIVSFGSIASGLPEVIIRNLLDAFRTLDVDGYRFVFRLINVEGFEIPPNVKVSSWIPQNELLGHEAVKLFITHCGNSGQYESVFQGKPMIGFPLFSDQHYNANRMEHKGFGISMNIRTFTSEELVHNVHRIIANRSYKDRVMKAAQIFRNDPQSPAERASYWIEHICRFGGDHLRSAGQDLPLYAYVMFDILAFVVVVLGVVVVCIWNLLKCVINRYLRKSPDASGRKDKFN